MPGLQRQRLLVTRQRLVEEAERVLGVAKVGVRRRDVRIDANRLLDQRDSLGVAAALPFDHAQQMQRAEVRRLAGEHLAVQRGRFVELAAAVQRQRLFVALAHARRPVAARGQAVGDAVPAGMSQLKVRPAPSDPSLVFCGLYSIFTVLKTISIFCMTLPSSVPFSTPW